jgi:hypothetical protein
VISAFELLKPRSFKQTATKWTITAATLGLAAAAAVGSFAHPLVRALRLYQPANLYFYNGFPSWAFLASLVLSVAAAFALVLALCFAASRAGASVQTTEKVLGAVVITVAGITLSSRVPPVILCPAMIASAFVCASAVRLGRAVRAMLWRACLIIAGALAAVLIYEIAGAAFSLGEPQARGFTGSARSGRITIVLLFDELDQELAFDLRPGRIAIPNLADFDQSALHATHVSPVASWTIQAIPSLLTGRTFAYAEQVSPTRLELHAAKGAKTALNARDTIFANIRATGINIAALGWHHPYCRLFATELAACESFRNLDATPSTRVALYFRKNGATILTPFANPATQHIREQYDVVAEEQYHQVQRGLRTLAGWIADRRLGFIWAHFPCPHPPGMAASSGGHRRLNYFDNLALVDDIVGQVTSELKRNGRWNDSIIAITGDHGLRRSVWEDRPTWTSEEDRLVRLRHRESVPLMIHLPGQTEHISVSEEMSGIVLHDLVLGWTQDRLTQPGALASWFAGQHLSQR